MLKNANKLDLLKNIFETFDNHGGFMNPRNYEIITGDRVSDIGSILGVNWRSISGYYSYYVNHKEISPKALEELGVEEVEEFSIPHAMTLDYVIEMLNIGSESVARVLEAKDNFKKYNAELECRMQDCLHALEICEMNNTEKLEIIEEMTRIRKERREMKVAMLSMDAAVKSIEHFGLDKKLKEALQKTIENGEKNRSLSKYYPRTKNVAAKMIGG